VKQSNGDSLLALVMVASVILGLFSFAQISLVVTFIVSSILLFALLVFLWWAGRRKRKGKSSRP
jgi:hypothetical protein